MEALVQPKTWRLWERPARPAAFQITERDVEVLRMVGRYRFVRPAHVHALFGGSPTNLNRRLRLLWEHGYLERPKALRPTKILTEQLVYGLGREGARLLEQRFPTLRVGQLDWTPKKQVGWPYVDHQLGIVDCLVTLQLACDRRDVRLHWDGHANRLRYVLKLPGAHDSVLPDAYFKLETAGHETTHCFLEVDRGSVSLQRMHERYEHYFAWWRQRIATHGRYRVRVLTITEDPAYVDSLRRVAADVGRDQGHASWRGLLFGHRWSFNLKHPERILDPIFRYASARSGDGHSDKEAAADHPVALI